MTCAGTSKRAAPHNCALDMCCTAKSFSQQASIYTIKAAAILNPGYSDASAQHPLPSTVALTCTRRVGHTSCGEDRKKIQEQHGDTFVATGLYLNCLISLHLGTKIEFDSGTTVPGNAYSTRNSWTLSN